MNQETQLQRASMPVSSPRGRLINDLTALTHAKREYHPPPARPCQNNSSGGRSKNFRPFGGGARGQRSSERNTRVTPPPPASLPSPTPASYRNPLRRHRPRQFFLRRARLARNAPLPWPHPRFGACPTLSPSSGGAVRPGHPFEW